MPLPAFDMLLTEGIVTSEQESSELIDKVDAARTAAAYWQGKAEGLELAIVHLNAGREREIQALKEGHELTLGYLKDRLNRLEAK